MDGTADLWHRITQNMLIGFKAIQVYLYTLYEYICSLAVEDKGMDGVEREEKEAKEGKGAGQPTKIGVFCC